MEAGVSLCVVVEVQSALKIHFFSGPYLCETKMGFQENKSCWVQILQNDFALSSQGVGVVESK